MRKQVLALIAAFVGTLLAVGIHLPPVQAQNEGKSVLANPPDPTETDIIRALKPLTRGLGERTRSISAGPSNEREQIKEIARRRDLVDLRIGFEPNSDRLTATGKQVLTALGGALKRPEFASSRFAIVGHTDARGSEQYNQQLSERRAAAVKEYLVRTAGIDEARLIAIGLGKSKPLADPLAAENRRVEIVNLRN